MTTPEAFIETNKDLMERTGKVIEIIREEAEGNVILVSHGDVITAMLEGVVERKVITEKYFVLEPDPAALSIVEIKDKPKLVQYNYHRKMFADF